MAIKEFFGKFFKKEAPASGHYLTGREVRAIAKANAKVMFALEKRKHRIADESEFVTTMQDNGNILEIDDLHTYFFIALMKYSEPTEITVTYSSSLIESFVNFIVPSSGIFTSIKLELSFSTEFSTSSANECTSAEIEISSWEIVLSATLNKRLKPTITIITIAKREKTGRRNILILWKMNSCREKPARNLKT